MNPEDQARLEIDKMLTESGWIVQDYVVQDDDKILISYGAETPKEIKSQLEELESQPIIK